MIHVNMMTPITVHIIKPRMTIVPNVKHMQKRFTTILLLYMNSNTKPIYLLIKHYTIPKDRDKLMAKQI